MNKKNCVGNQTFITISNQDIYCKLLDIEKHVLKTNGKVKLNYWIATTAITIATIAMGFAFK